MIIVTEHVQVVTNKCKNVRNYCKKKLFKLSFSLSIICALNNHLYFSFKNDQTNPVLSLYDIKLKMHHKIHLTEALEPSSVNLTYNFFVNSSSNILKLKKNVTIGIHTFFVTTGRSLLDW